MIFFLGIMLAHFIGDFICQTDWQARNKSKNWYALSLHVSTYTIVMSISFYFLSILLGPQLTVLMYYKFMFLTFITHFLTDAVTSRINTYLWNKGRTHDFFVCVGFDQYVHQITLAVTLYYVGMIS